MSQPGQRPYTALGPNRGSASVLVAAALWGTTGTAAALAPEVGPLAVGAAAMGIGGLLQAAAASRLMTRHRASLRARWRVIAIAAAATAIYPLAFYTSMRLAGVAVGTVVSIGSAPLAAAVIERLADGRRLSRRWALGAGLGLLGVAALTAAHRGGSDPAPGASEWRSLAGIGLGLLAGITYALYSWGAGRLMTAGVPSRAAMGTVLGLGGLLLVPVVLAVGGPIAQSGPSVGRGLAVVAYLAIVPMFVGYLLFGRGLAAGLTASTATVLTLLEPGVATSIAIVVLHERLSGIGWIGLALLLVSLISMTGLRRSDHDRSLRRAVH